MAAAVQTFFPDTEVSINQNAQPDKRSYKVSFNLYEEQAADHQPRVSLSAAIEDLKNGLLGMNFNDKNFRQSNLIRLKSIQSLVDNSLVDANLFIK